ncbi:hypothetical protein UFOVP256_60 [uncultured Caudovirales phage]|uniref:Uncharacterized protein n=1 Tax=uncultured Caudovirales phage TaxID=2100421 RepID=A0A6J5LEZ7_9CAUD|nr:hypothetical protein UFOVP256_60 [uncultured Caudovirales phage]
MAQYIKQGNIFGRIGSGLGKGLAEQIPKEIERTRLASGLKQAAEQGGTPYQQFAAIAPYAYDKPQVLQTAGELLRQDAYLKAIKNQYEGQGGPKAGKAGYTPTQEDLSKPVKGEVPTLATPEDTAQSYKSYIPPTEQEERKDAFENFNANPARYNYDFENALQERKAITGRNQQIQQAHQTQEATAVAKEEKIKEAFDKEAKRLGIIPVGDAKGEIKANFDPKLYQMFEERLLNSILPKSDGGEGLTQEQATKKYSGDLLTAFRNYQDLGKVTSWSPREFNRQVDAVQKNFAHFGQPAKQVIMDRLIAEQQVSPSYAAHKAYPIKKGDMPTINKLGIKVGTPTISGVSMPMVNDATYAQLKKEMGKENSPLSVGYELEQKGQSARGWLNYLNNHRDDLEVWQADHLTKNLNVFDLKDMWLRAWE